VINHLQVRADGREAVFGTGLGEITLGSARGCEVRLTGASVAGRHLVLRYSGEHWVLETLSAAHPVFLDGQPLETARINEPLEFRIGDPISGPRLELAPASLGSREVTVDFESTPPSPWAATQASAAAFSLAAGLLRIGRDPESDVVVEDVLVSRRHAEIRRVEGGRYEVVDLGSHNGTFLNGRRVERSALAELDVVGIGRNSYRLLDGRLEEYVDKGEVAFAAVELTVRLDSRAVLLDRASFSLDSRSLLAVVGPSGAGKSTLLNALTGFRMADEGDVRYGDRSLYADYGELRQRVGFVPQADIVHGELTVARELEFAADLRFPTDVDAAERRRRVEQVMAELGIADRRRTPVSRLSGGERKRVSVGLELLTAPSLLILDEPTSGLDPNFERSLMELFRQLADLGRTIIVATHTVQSLPLCDRVLVLAPGGRVAYFGPPQLLLAYFDEAEFADVFHQLSEPGEVDWGARFRKHPYHAEYVERGVLTRLHQPGNAPVRRSQSAVAGTSLRR
jgi:ABC-type multidrug transport system ATPase subunit